VICGSDLDEYNACFRALSEFIWSEWQSLTVQIGQKAAGLQLLVGIRNWQCTLLALKFACINSLQIVTDQVEQSVGCVCVYRFVCMDNNFWNKWPLTYIFHTLVLYLETIKAQVRFEGQGDRSKFTVTGRKQNAASTGMADRGWKAD